MSDHIAIVDYLHHEDSLLEKKRSLVTLDSGERGTREGPNYRGSYSITSDLLTGCRVNFMPDKWLVRVLEVYYER